MPLSPGQYQIGSVIMGPGTPFKIEEIVINNYEINVQDYQSQSSDEIRMGTDTLKPAPIQMTINVLRNRALPNIVGLVGGSSPTFSDDTLEDLQREWRADEVRFEWGALKPLYFCGEDGIVRQFNGRPGKFSYRMHKQINGLFYQVTAEFRRSDTLAYSANEYYVSFPPG